MFKKDSTWMGIMWCAVGAVLFSIKAILVKIAYQYEIDSVSLLTLRMLFTLPIFLVIGDFVAWLRKKSEFVSL